jgi:hypothetical protein
MLLPGVGVEDGDHQCPKGQLGLHNVADQGLAPPIRVVVRGGLQKEEEEWMRIKGI